MALLGMYRHCVGKVEDLAFRLPHRIGKMRGKVVDSYFLYHLHSMHLLLYDVNLGYF